LFFVRLLNNPPVEPLAVDLDQIAQISKPDLMGDSSVSRTLVGVGEARRPRDRRMGLFIESHHLPDRRVAMAIPQGIQGHLHAVMPQEGIVVQENVGLRATSKTWPQYFAE
jgi:hypothetical protein